MNKLLKVITGIFGTLGTIGNIIVSLALSQVGSYTRGGDVTYTTRWSTFFLFFIATELSVAVICVVLVAISNIIEKLDELLYYSHKNTEPQPTTNSQSANTITQPTQNNTPVPANASNSRMQLFEGQAQSEPVGAWTCKKCGTVNNSNAQFCKNCGEYK